MISRPRLIVIALIPGILFSAVSGAKAFDPDRLDFAILVNEQATDYSVLAQSVMPGEVVRIKSVSKLIAKAQHGYLEYSDNSWRWTAPVKSGLYPLELQHAGQIMILNMFVMRPATDLTNGYLGKYRIGEYPQQPFKGLAVYRPPEGFIEVWPEYQNVPVSPHFKLKQFLCKQQASTWPKYMLLRPELLLKLENILERLNAKGIRTDSFAIMSGYRTPWYNRSIGNRTNSSRHLYGGAADIFVDVNPKDGVMDDVNGDGQLDKSDANYLYDLFEAWSAEPWWRRHTGGLAAYGAKGAHGPFVHVDSRGYRARWVR